VAQVILRWEIQSGIITIPKSSNPARLEENISIFDFSLPDGDMALIDGLDYGRRIGPHPDECNDLF
jgi:diketogulonate reductase-like aldo/keto reductase